MDVGKEKKSVENENRLESVQRSKEKMRNKSSPGARFCHLAVVDADGRGSEGSQALQEDEVNLARITSITFSLEASTSSLSSVSFLMRL